MAKKPSPTPLARLTPNAIVVTVNGESVRVASSKDEHQIMMMFLAARMNNIINTTLDDYKNDGVKFTPRELKELASAARDINTLGVEVWATAEPIKTPSGPPVEDVTEISFETLHTPPEVKETPPTQDEQPS
jgi:hypothetical protein